MCFPSIPCPRRNIELPDIRIHRCAREPQETIPPHQEVDPLDALERLRLTGGRIKDMTATVEVCCVHVLRRILGWKSFVLSRVYCRTECVV